MLFMGRGRHLFEGRAGVWALWEEGGRAGVWALEGGGTCSLALTRPCLARSRSLPHLFPSAKEEKHARGKGKGILALVTTARKVVFPPESLSRVADVWRWERAGVGSPALIGRSRCVSMLIGCSTSSWRRPVRREFQFQIF